MTNDLDRLIELEKECRRVGILVNKQFSRKYKNIMNDHLSDYYILEYKYFLENIFHNREDILRWGMVYHSLDIPICPYCNSKERIFVGGELGFKATCGDNKCIQQRKCQTNLEKYGGIGPLSSEKSKEKYKQTCLKRLGVEYPAQSKDVITKIQNTCIKHYGVKAPLQLDSVKEKVKQTCREKYGTDYYLQSESGKEKHKQFCIDRYGVDCNLKSPIIREKIAKTNLYKYGCENVFANEDIKEKIKQTNLEKYGFEYYTKTDEYKEKSKQTCKEKYGTEYSLQSKEVHDKVIETWKSKYGVDHPLKSKEVREKINQTFIDHYGVDNPFKSRKIQDKIKDEYGSTIYRTYFYNNVYFDSSYELVFYKYCIDHDISIAREPIRFDYLDKDNVIRYYYPDFKISYNNKFRLIEISSWYTWSTKSDEKKKVIKDNNILVLLDKDIEKYFDYCKEIKFDYQNYKINKKKYKNTKHKSILKIPPTTFCLEYKE